MLHKGLEVYSVSMLNKFASCRKAYDYRYNQMLTHENKSVNMSFGSTIHDGIAAWYKTHDIAAVVNAMEQTSAELKLPDNEVDPKHSLQRARDVMMKYIDRYKDNDINVLAVEVPFLVEVETKTKPFLFAGTIDGLAEMIDDENNNRLYILENKTTSRMGTSYLKGYRPNNQITAYWWALTKYMDRPIYGAILNIIYLLTKETSFIRNTTRRAQWELDRWEDDLRKIVEDIRMAVNDNRFYLNTSQCAVMGLCPYHTLCNTDPGNLANFIAAEYKSDVPGDLRWLFEQEKEFLNVG
jgi:PD-(D/E)XK nuclease superfamily